MTLVLVTADGKGDLTVIADTLFGEGGRTGSEVGPKIFLVRSRSPTWRMWVAADGAGEGRYRPA